MTYRAVISDELGPIGNYTLRPYDPGAPKAGHVRIRVKAAGVSFVDVLNATGKYQARAPVPFIPGSECAGVIEAVGSGVDGLAVGQSVVASAWGGLFADAANIRAESVNLLPEGLGFEEASVFTVSVATAWHALVDRGRLQRGETVLVLGAGGATGYAAVQIARYLGATVIASASSDDKRVMALAGGADTAVEAASDTWREDVKAANNGRPIDVVFDPVGGDGTERAFRCLGWDGRHLVVGFPAGIASVPTNLALLKSASLVGVNLQKFREAKPDQAASTMKTVFQRAGQGLFKPVIAQTFRLEQFAEAMAVTAEGRTAGRIVLVMDQ